MTMLTAMLALAGMLVMTLVVPDGAVPYAGESWQVVAPNLSPYLSVGDDWHILNLAASASLSGYAFAQVQDSTPPTFDSSELDLDAGVLTITFSETIDAAGVVQILVFQAYMVSLYLHFIAFDFLYVVEFSRSRI